MIEQGKQKMDHLRQLGTIDEQVMVKLYDIITPLDEREDYRASVTKAAGQEARAKKLEKLMSAADQLALRKAKNRELKAERAKQQSRKPDRDILMSGEDTTEYGVTVNNQIVELKSILSQSNVIMSETELERALRFPSFNWNDTLFQGKPTFPGAGAGLMHDTVGMVKKKKAPKKKGHSKKRS
jgi:hypothetical protein